MKNFRDLNVWEKAHRLTLRIYHITKAFPTEERYAITSQLRRTAVSVPTNIAEGCGRSSDADFGRFLEIAFGSASELEYLILLSRDLEFIDSASHNKLANEVGEVKRMLFSFIQKLRERN